MRSVRRISAYEEWDEGGRGELFEAGTRFILRLDIGIG